MIHVGAYEVSMMVLSTILFGVYVRGLVRLRRDQNAKRKTDHQPIKPRVRAARV